MVILKLKVCLCECGAVEGESVARITVQSEPGTRHSTNPQTGQPAKYERI